MKSSTSQKSEFDYKVFKDILPVNHLSLIAESLNNTIGLRHIRYILNGKRTDHYGVIDKAIELAIIENKKREQQAKRIAQLTK